MNFINLTSHPIAIEGLGTLKPSGVVTRVALNRTPGLSIGAVRVIKQSFGAVESLPDPKQVFQKYYRSPQARRSSGTGLGLYLVWHLAKLHSPFLL